MLHDEEWYMITADHVVEYNDSVSQGNQEFGVGSSVGSAYYDYRLVERTNPNISLSCSVDYQDGSYELGGHATNLEALEDDGETIYKTGVTTGYETGTINGVLTAHVTTTNTNAEVDSGGPLFYLEDFGDPMGVRAVVVSISTSGDGKDVGEIDCLGVSRTVYQGTLGPKPEEIVNDNNDPIVFAGCSS